MTALEYLKSIPRLWLPCEPDSDYSENGHRVASNSDLARWLKACSVEINRKTPKPQEQIEFPVRQIVFFPKGKRKTTILDLDEKN